jgi:hypothetical protein
MQGFLKTCKWAGYLGLLALELKFHLELVKLRGGSSTSGSSHSAAPGGGEMVHQFH